MTDDASRATLIVLQEGASAYEALGALAALRAAGHAVELVSTEALVHAKEGVRVVPHRLGFDAVPHAACVIVPDGDAERIARDAPLARTLRERRGRWTLASGAAVPLLVATGLALGRDVASAHPIPGANARPARLVADARILTCESGDAIIDLALHYVAQVDGMDAAARAAHAMGREHRPFVMGANVQDA